MKADISLQVTPGAKGDLPMLFKLSDAFSSVLKTSPATSFPPQLMRFIQKTFHQIWNQRGGLNTTNLGTVQGRQPL